MRPLLVGEDNLHSSDQRYSLYPYPESASGGRLCRILGISPWQYLRTFDRMNLRLQGEKWSDHNVVVRVELLYRADRPVILLGAKVCKAVGIPYVPFTSRGNLHVLPHPSGRCRVWNEHGAAAQARAFVELACLGFKLTVE